MMNLDLMYRIDRILGKTNEDPKIAYSVTEKIKTWPIHTRNGYTVEEMRIGNKVKLHITPRKINGKRRWTLRYKHKDRPGVRITHWGQLLMLMIFDGIE